MRGLDQHKGGLAEGVIRRLSFAEFTAVRRTRRQPQTRPPNQAETIRAAHRGETTNAANLAPGGNYVDTLLFTHFIPTTMVVKRSRSNADPGFRFANPGSFA
jgi:hypothetical protein